MAPRDNQELVPLTDGSGRATDDDQPADGQRRKKPVAGTGRLQGGRGGDDDDGDDDDGGGCESGKTGRTVRAAGPVGDVAKSVTACQQIVVGLGTLWRFPYVCLKYGGGEFPLSGVGPTDDYMILQLFPW